MNPQAPTNEVREILRKTEFSQSDIDVLVEGIESLTIEEKVRLLFMITGHTILSNNPRNFTIPERMEAGKVMEKRGDEVIPSGPEDVGGKKKSVK